MKKALIIAIALAMVTTVSIFASNSVAEAAEAAVISELKSISFDYRPSMRKGQIRVYLPKKKVEKLSGKKGFTLDLEKKTLMVGDKIYVIVPTPGKKGVAPEAGAPVVSRVTGEDGIMTMTFTDGKTRTFEGECLKVYLRQEYFGCKWGYPKKGRGDGKHKAVYRAPWS